MLSKSFEQYKFNEFVNKAVIDLGFDNPTKIQERVFSPVLKGKNIEKDFFKEMILNII